MFFSSAIVHISIYITFPQWPKCRHAIDGAYRNHQKLMITFFGFQPMTHDIPWPGPSFILRPSPPQVLIMNGELLSGIVCKKTVRLSAGGKGACGSLLTFQMQRSGPVRPWICFLFCSSYSHNSQILQRSWDAGEISPVMFIGLESSQNCLYPPWTKTWTKWCASTYGKCGPHLENLAISLLKWMGIFQFPTLNCQRIPQGKR